jgi:hypothetical protein
MLNKFRRGRMLAVPRRTVKREAVVMNRGTNEGSVVPPLDDNGQCSGSSFYEALGFAIDERWEEKRTLPGEAPSARRPIDR